MALLRKFIAGAAGGAGKAIQAEHQAKLARQRDEILMNHQQKMAQLSASNTRGKSSEQIDRELSISEESNSIRRDELELRKEQGGRVKISPTVQKILDKAQTSAVDSGNDARDLELLANDFIATDVGGGVASTTSEKFKQLVGSQEDVSDLRRRFRSFRASQAVSNLPPGVASDKDIELALSGFPAENANNNIILSFLKGQAKLARINEAYNILKSEIISDQGDTRGLVKKWKERLDDKDFQNSLFSGISGINSVDDSSTGAVFEKSKPAQRKTKSLTSQKFTAPEKDEFSELLKFMTPEERKAFR